MSNAITVKCTDQVALFQVKLHAIAICAQAGVPYLLVGEPGNAKTAIVEAVNRRVCAAHYTSIPALNDPAHYAGYPSKGKTEDGTEIAVMLPNEWLVKLAKEAAATNHRVGLFFDELSSAPPATRAACLRGILQGAWGDHTIQNSSPGAAMNPPHLAEGAYDLSAALANRFAHFEWDPPTEWWDEQRMLGFPDPEVVALPADWRKYLHKANALHSAFVRVKPGLAQKCPDQADLRSKAWPSFRTSEWACELLAACFALGGGADSDLALILVSAVIGPGPAREFLTYCQELDLPDPEALLKDPTGLKLPQRGDRAYAVLTSVVSAVLANNTPARWNAAWEVLAQAVEMGRADVAATSARMLGRNRPKGSTKTPKAVGAFVPLLKAAGMMGA